MPTFCVVDKRVLNTRFNVTELPTRDRAGELLARVAILRDDSDIAYHELAEVRGGRLYTSFYLLPDSLRVRGELWVFNGKLARYVKAR